MFNKKRQKGTWKDKSGQWNGKNGVKESTIYLGDFKLSIHHYVGSGDEWFTSCSTLFHCHSLTGHELGSLKIQALAKFEQILIDAKEDIPHTKP